MSTYDDMARDGGYQGDQAAEVAHVLERQHRAEVEREADRWDSQDEMALCPMTGEVCVSRQCATSGCDIEREEELGEDR